MTTEPKYWIFEHVGKPVLGLLFTSILGGAIAFAYSSMQAEAAFEASLRQAAAQNRIELADSTAQLLSERMVHANMVASAILNKAPNTEIQSRWKNYQAAYINYNANNFKFRSASTVLLGEETSKDFQKTLDGKITPSFARLDDCLTRAYYAHQTDEALGGEILRKCGLIQVDGKAFAWKFGDQRRLLQTCIGGFDDMVLKAIYLENMRLRSVGKSSVPGISLQLMKLFENPELGFSS